MGQNEDNLCYRKLNKEKLPNLDSKLMEKYYNMLQNYLRKVYTPNIINTKTFKAIVEL